MRVAVDQSGQYRIGGQVDHSRTGGDDRVGPDLFNTVASDDDDGIPGQGTVYRVEQLTTANGRDVFRLNGR
jgi:hypothetical protein